MRENILQRVMRSLPLAPLFLLAFSLSLKAQTGAGKDYHFDVQVGDEFEYEGVTRTEIETEAEGVPQKLVQESVSLDVLSVDSLSADEIFWGLSMIVTIGQGGAGEELEYTKKNLPLTMHMKTDRQGRVKNLDMGSQENGMAGGGDFMSMMTSNSKGTSQGPGWFLPEEIAARKPGDVWVVPSIDTVSVTLVGTMKLDMVTTSSITYTYDGTVDTLGVKAVRIRWTYDTLKIVGGLTGTDDMPGFTMSMDGDGEGQGVTWYSLKDKLQLVQVNDMTMVQELNISMPEGIGSFQDKTQLIRTVMHTEQSRQD